MTLGFVLVAIVLTIIGAVFDSVMAPLLTVALVCAVAALLTASPTDHL